MFIQAILVLCIPLVLERGTRGKHLTPSRFYETSYAVSYGIVDVVLPRVFPISFFYFALGHVLTPPESDPIIVRRGIINISHCYIYPFKARSSFFLVPYWIVAPRPNSICARLTVMAGGAVALWLSHLHSWLGSTSAVPWELSVTSSVPSSVVNCVSVFEGSGGSICAPAMAISLLVALR